MCVFQEKDEVNSLNKYSQNFFGLYCTCSRPYPDPDDQVRKPSATRPSSRCCPPVLRLCSVPSLNQCVSVFTVGVQVEDEMIQCVVCEDWLHGRVSPAPKPPAVMSQL